MIDKIKAHEDLCKKLNETYKSKNSDYGDSFEDTFNKFGIISALTRITDKYNRLISLCTKSGEERKVKDESVIDTLLDMANYCMMTVIELEKDKSEQNSCNHEWEYAYTKIDGSELHNKHIYCCIKCGALTETDEVDVI